MRRHELIDYITCVAEQSNRIPLEVIGYRHERRPILFVVVTLVRELRPALRNP